jgi:RNase adapter protein RapZ
MKQLIIVSGRSGSGKTIALHALEDLGFYCIDNLPVAFLPMLEQTIGNIHSKVAISIDSRNLQLDLVEIRGIINQLNSCYKNIKLFYLDSNDNILLQRFSDTRRKHPLTKEQGNCTLREAIIKERGMLLPIANLADYILDTSKLSHHELYNFIRVRVANNVKIGQIHLLLQSFGFKHGLPADADFVFDVRCLPNPYWQLNLRHLTGLDQEVISFLENSSLVQEMTKKIVIFIKDWLECFKVDYRSYITIALGCTGGKHRSVYLANHIAEQLRDVSFDLANVQVRHRELSKV